MARLRQWLKRASHGSARSFRHGLPSGLHRFPFAAPGGSDRRGERGLVDWASRADHPLPARCRRNGRIV